MAVLINNKRVPFDYTILEKMEAGLELHGWEVKSIKGKKVSLAGARILIRGGEAFAVGINIQPYQPKNTPESSEGNRTLKLLLRKKEINHLATKLNQKGLTIVPIKLYDKGNKIKAEIALVKGKKKQDKREHIKKRESNVKIGRLLKNTF